MTSVGSSSIRIYPEIGRLGPFPADQPVSEAFRKYHKLYAETTLALEQNPEWQSVLTPEGTYCSNFSLSEYGKMCKALTEAGEVPRAPSATAEPIPGLTAEDIEVPDSDLLVRVYNPPNSSDQPVPTFLYYHGGGMVMSNRFSGENYVSRVVSTLNMPAVTVEYRLGPEHKFPAGHDDAWKAYEWTRDHLAEYLGTELDGIVLGGISSGANLCLSVAHRVASEADNADDMSKVIKGIVVGVPVCDATPDGLSKYKEWQDISNPSMNSTKITWFHDQYARTPEDKLDPRWSLVFEDPEVLAKLPPLTIMTASLDPLRGEARAYASKVSDAGGEVTLLEYENLPHTAPVLDAICPEARKGNTKLVEAVGRAAGFGDNTLAQVTVEGLFSKPVWQNEA